MRRLLKSFDTKEEAIQYLNKLSKDGAHYWFLVEKTQTCRYCGEERPIPPLSSYYNARRV